MNERLCNLASLAFLIAVVLGLVACGGDDVAPSEDTSSGDNVRFEQPGPTSNNDDDGPCTGCLEDGECRPGDTAAACGSGGGVCMECVGDEACVDGTCTRPMSGECGPDTCDGCCADGQCVTGGADDACGVGGGACQACDAGTQCNAGVCENATVPTNNNMMPDPCGPANCNGCCDATGTCVTGGAANACGAGGGQCADCSAAGEMCNGGVCEAPAPTCAMTCQGCCVGEMCVTATDDAQCGAGGAACVACGADEMCSAGACVEEPMMSGDRWSLTLVSASVPSTKLNGSSWDPGGGLPDVVMEMYAADPVGYWINGTFPATNELNPVWNVLMFAGLSNEALLNGIEFYMYDDEAFVDDICYQIEVVDPATINPGQDIVTTCNADPLVEWTWRLDRDVP